MDKNIQSQGSDNGETIDPQVPTSDGPLRDFDIQSPAGPASSPVIHGGDVETWKPLVGNGRKMLWALVDWAMRRFSQKPVVLKEEEKRWALALLVMRLFFVWVIIGLIVFLVSGSIWLLAGGTGVLTLPLTKVLGYYFYRPKK